MVYIDFNPGSSQAPWKPSKTTLSLTILWLTSKLSKWRSLWPPVLIPKIPPVLCTLFFNLHLCQAPWKTKKMTPHLTILRLISKLSKWRSPWPPVLILNWPPLWCTSFFNPDLSQAPWRTPKRTPQLTILHLISKLSKWRSLWPPVLILKWPPVWCTPFFNLDLSQAPWRTPKTTPHLTILHLTSKWSKWRSLWPPLFIPRWPPVWCTSFFNPDLSQAPWKTLKTTPNLP